MRAARTTFYRVFTIFIIGLLFLTTMLYFKQEELLFFPTKLPADYVFNFNSDFQEHFITTPDGYNLHGLLFRANPAEMEPANGLIFYLHGNAGGLESWGEIASAYTSLNYDIFMLDYRGYGKSEGRISSEKQFHDDVQLAYDYVKKEYAEEKIVVLGYSLGTGTAARLAAENHPRMLILQAPYYSIVDMAQRLYPMIPAAIIKYKFKTHEFLEKAAVPTILIHGDQDEVIYHGSSLKLKEHLKPTDKIYILEGQLHNGFTENEEYLALMQQLLTTGQHSNTSGAGSLQLEAE